MRVVVAGAGNVGRFLAADLTTRGHDVTVIDDVLGRNAEMTIELPTERLLAVVAIATIAGLVAGLLPARRAGRMEVLNAISAE